MSSRKINAECLQITKQLPLIDVTLSREVTTSRSSEISEFSNDPICNSLKNRQEFPAENELLSLEFNHVLVDFFWKAVEGKHQVKEIMDTWTRQMGFPVVTVTHVKGDVYRLEQTRFLLNPEDKFDPEQSRFRLVQKL